MGFFNKVGKRARGVMYKRRNVNHWKASTTNRRIAGEEGGARR